MSQENNATMVGRIDRRESGEIDGFEIGCVQRSVHGPFEPRYAGQIGKRSRRWELREEFQEHRAIFVEIGAVWRLGFDKDLDGRLEELGPDEPVHRGIGKAQCGG
jgi:hypothetical protein